MILKRVAQRFVLCLLVLLTLGDHVLAQVGDASRLYVAGRRAVLDGNWNEAVLYLTAAIERRSQEGGEVVVYGKHLEPYLPHFLLGVAFYELGALDTASEAWRESERQGRQVEVRERRHKTLADLLARYGSSLASTRALDEAESQLGELRRRFEPARNPAPELEERRRELEADMASAAADLEELRRSISSQEAEISRAMRLLDQVEALWQRSDDLVLAERDARRQALASRIRSAQCEETAIDDVLDVLHRGAAQLGAGPELGENPGSPTSNLVQDLIDRCGLSHDLLLAVARRPGLFDVVGQALGSAAGSGLSAEATSPAQAAESAKVAVQDNAVKEDLELLGRTPCHWQSMARLARWLEARALARVEAGEVSGSLARALDACGESGIAALYRGVDAGAGAISVAASKKSSTARLAEGWAETTLRIDAGLCDPDWRERLGAGIAWSSELEREISEQSGVAWAPDLYAAKSARNCGQRQGVAEYLSGASRLDQPVTGRRAEILQSLAAWYREQAAHDFYSGRHALIFAASDYGDGAKGWPDLPGARSDAEAVRDALLAYGFDQPRLVSDPSGRTVRREMKRFIEEYSGEEDENRLLLIYWAGHGAVLEGAYGGETWSTGFLVPVDAPYPHASLDPDSSFATRAVSMDSLDRWAREMQSRHAMFMLDSCYSGSAFQTFGRAETETRRRRLRPAPSPQGTWDPLARFRQPVRLIVASSAADQRAADRSQFRQSFIEWLERPSLADFRRDQVVSGSELCLHLAESTREASAGRQSPSCQCLSSPWDRGDVVFPASRESEPPSVVSRWVQRHLLADLATWRSLRENEDPESLEEYLHHYPQGRFAELARRRLIRGGGDVAF